MKIPEKVPEKGFYYHYKHDPQGAFNTYAYEFIGAGVHTEDDCRPEDQNLAVYRPLYEAKVYTAGQLFDIRPLEMWMGNVIVDDIEVPRFKKITDPELIKKLNEVRDSMYKGL